MKKLLYNILPSNDKNRRWLAIALTVLIAGALTFWGIYEIGEYGIALFILTPLLIGTLPTTLYGLKKQITKKEAFFTGLLTLVIFTAGLMIFAIEGLICIAMAAPLAFLMTWLGSYIGYKIVNNAKRDAPTAMLLLLLITPITAFLEKDIEPELNSVVTSIEINSDPHTVWKNVIEFPLLDEPTEFIFKTGIAYPTNATIEGSGIRAVRHCNFTTGSFVEPITIWDEPSLLKFDVLEQPASMKELSFWDIDAPHLHDYFVSKQGQFRIVELANGKTLLEGTTWYYHNIKPSFYWQLWSEYIIHKIHYRVLDHIRKNAEGEEIVAYPITTTP